MNIQTANRIVIKIGSSLVTDTQKGVLKEEWLKTFIEDVVNLLKQGKAVVIVTSGAISLGKRYITSAKQPLKLEEKQAAAACGQTELVRNYQKYLHKYKRHAAQILLTLQDSDNRRNYLNAKNTIETLLANGIVPVINENDTVATHQIRFGDNDRLAARVAQMVGADLLIILSDIDGLYEANPQLYPNAPHIPKVTRITKKIQLMAGNPLSGVGTGGMITKLQAAKIATSNGCHMIIAKGTIKHPIKRLGNGAKHTLFTAVDSPMNARKRWFYNKLSITGDIIIDDGAYKALLNGKSLLPAGVIAIQGTFERGDAVIIRNSKQEEVGRGLVAYSANDAKLIIGHQSSDIANIVGFSGRNELIHRDDMVINDESNIVLPSE